MKSRDVQLQYSYQPHAQRGPAVQHALFDLLAAVRVHGSIQRAAQGLGVSYRHVWGALKQWQDLLGEPLVSWTQGHPARLTPYAERLLLAETQVRARMAPQIDALRAELERVLADALDGPRQVLSLHGSPDPALQALRDTARGIEMLHLELHGRDGLDALRALAEGRCTLAALHVPLRAELGEPLARSARPLLRPRGHRLIGCSRRMLGLAVAPGNPLALHTLADVLRRRARCVQSPRGSGARLLAERLLALEGLAAADLLTPLVEEHGVAVAAAVAGGLADAGLAAEVDARRCGLDFVPLAEEACLLVGDEAALALPAVQALRRALRDPAWHEAVAVLPGCAVMQPGELLTPAQALPWWSAVGRGQRT